jgi:hypothetical protein
MILGMDIGVFTAWILTILAAILCLLYGIYCEFLKKDTTEQRSVITEKQPKKEEN